MAPRLNRFAIVALAGVVALAGCTTTPDDDHDDDGHTHSETVASEDVVEVRIPDGAYDPEHDGVWFDIDAASFEVPTTLRFINDDTVFHRAVGNYVPSVAHRPDWVDAHAQDDHGHGNETAGDHHGDGGGGENEAPGAGHGHTDDGGDGLAFDVSLEPGDHQDVQIDRSGHMIVHCHPHAWMVDEWDALSEHVGSYDVVVNALILAKTTAGDLAMGHEGENEVALNVTLAAPNLAALKAVLEWDDSEDDGPAGEPANEPDAFRLALVDPGGSVVAEETLVARMGGLRVEFLLDGRAWPESVEGRSPADAAQRLSAAHPDDDAWIGTWIVQVELLQAPGYLPPEVDDGSAVHDAPAGYGFDGHQTWSLTVTAVHEWAAISTEQTEVLGGLQLGDEEAGHEH